MTVTVTVTVPDELAARLRTAAAARGMGLQQLALEVLSRVEVERVVEPGFSALVSEAITEHQGILDRLAAT